MGTYGGSSTSTRAHSATRTHSLSLNACQLRSRARNAREIVHYLRIYLGLMIPYIFEYFGEPSVFVQVLGQQIFKISFLDKLRTFLVRINNELDHVSVSVQDCIVERVHQFRAVSVHVGPFVDQQFQHFQIVLTGSCHQRCNVKFVSELQVEFKAICATLKHLLSHL